jgi:hypothetical protein
MNRLDALQGFASVWIPAPGPCRALPVWMALHQWTDVTNLRD